MNSTNLNPAVSVQPAASRIVVIEDDPAILKGLEAVLCSQSYDVLTAVDGEAGYRLVRDRQPDLVILDLMLPKMNGYEICRQVRQHGLSTPILMLTAQSQESSRVQGFDAGADDYVTKPFSVRELLGRVKAILRRSEGRADLANQRELDEARQIQQRLMPSEIPQLPGFQIDGTWTPARITSGDYFDVFPLDSNTLAICIADVCGKGMPAAMIMSNLQAAVRSHASREMSPRNLCGHLNRLMCRNIASQGFITCFYAVIESAPKRITYCNAGHNPAILASRESILKLDCGGTVLGVLEDWNYQEQTVQLSSADRMVMYTDGITECRNAAGDEFGEDQLIEVIRRFKADGANTMAQAVLRSAGVFANGNFEDDLTVISIVVD
jgi:sigma-B regulation protein RsbU (phosphoserine phosphatase)